MINVKHFGVIGNGIVDDAPAIQRLIQKHGWQALYFPPGHYLIGQTLKVK